MDSLTNKVAIITGASSGIGRATALELAKEGCKVALIGRNKERLIAVLNEVKQYSIESTAVICDVRNYDQVKKSINEIIRRYNHVDILVNSAGMAINREFKNETMGEINEILDTNLFGIINSIKCVSPSMIRMKSGMIVNLGSLAGLVGLPGLSVYSASKFAVVGLSQALYSELKKYGISVIIVHPAATETNIFNHPSWQNFPHDKRHPKLLKPTYVAKEIVKAIKKDKFEVIIPKTTKIKLAWRSLLPSLYRWYIDRIPR